MALYARTGFRGTGLMAIGQAAGVTHAGVLYHFGSVQNLLQAVIDERDRRFWRETADTWAGKEGLAALRLLPKLAEWSAANIGLTKLFLTLVVENVEPDADAHVYFLTRQRRVRRRIRRTIEAGQRRGEIRPDIDARRKADEVVSFMEGAIVTVLLDPTVDMVTLFDTYTDALVGALAVEARGAARTRRRAASAGGRR
jgi:AcrR family transcriptional regulator